MDWNVAIEFAQLVNAAYAIPPADLTNRAGTPVTAGSKSFTVLTSIYANDLATDLNFGLPPKEVSIGLVCQADGTGDIAIALRGTEGIPEWIHDAVFLQVPCPFLPGSGHTDDGFTAMYSSMRVGVAPGSMTVVQALATLTLPIPITSVTICGHSLGGALATLLALDVAANTSFNDPTVYTFASPRTGDSVFASTFNQVVKNSYRVANRMDIVPKLPPPLNYLHVNTDFELNPIQILPLPPKFLLKMDLGCEHALDSYLYLMSLNAGGTILPLDPNCVP
jgi:hypothetical protein